MDDKLEELRMLTRPLSYLMDVQPESFAQIQAFLDKNKLDAGNLNFAGVIGRNGDFTIIFSRENGQIEGAVAVNPWVQ
jgi:hypothetical protein